MRFLTRFEETDPRSAATARPSRSRSFSKSEISFAKSKFAISFASYCTSSASIGQVGIGIKRGSGPSESKFWLQDGAAGIDPDLVLSREVSPGRPHTAFRLLRLFRLRIDFRSHLQLLPRLKMSQKPSLPHSPRIVQIVLTGNTAGLGRAVVLPYYQ